MRFANALHVRSRSAAVLILTIAAVGSLQQDIAPTQGAYASGSKCRTALAVGSVDRLLQETVLLDGQILTVEGGPLCRGDVLNTKKGGSVVFTLKLPAAECTLESGSVLAVRPAKRVGLSLKVGDKWCGPAPPKGEARFATAAPAAWSFEGGSTKVTGKDALFGIKVTAGRKVVVKVVRGVVVVSSRKGGIAAAVVVGKKRQVTIPAGLKPLPARPIDLSKRDQSAIKALGPFPRPSDNTPPTVTFSINVTQRDPPTVRARFEASESDVIFSCRLDRAPLHLCPNPTTFTLAPGRHTFILQGTDQAGNTSEPVSLSLTVEKPAPQRIAFESLRDDNFDIYVMNLDGSNQTRLTTDPALDFVPDWSPDRKKLVFHSDRDGNFEIYVMNADGTNQTRLTSNPATDRNATWSPDGKKIAFETYRHGTTSEIYVMNADGTGQTRLTTNQVRDLDPAWSPDGTKIAFASDRDGNPEIYVMNADGTGQTRLTTTQSREFHPAWSPDGAKIAFHTNRDQGNWEIYVMRSDGTAPTRITVNSSGDFGPSWSPDGDKIAFQTDRDDGVDIFEIYVMNADGSSLTRLTNNSVTDQVPDW